MTVPEMVMFAGGVVTVVGSIVAVVWTMANRPSYEYCDKTYQRADTHIIEYNVILEKLKKIQEDIEVLKNGSH